MAENKTKNEPQPKHKNPTVEVKRDTAPPPNRDAKIVKR